MQIITDVLKRNEPNCLKIRAYRKLHASGEIEISFPIKISPSKIIIDYASKTPEEWTHDMIKRVAEDGRELLEAERDKSEERITALSERSDMVEQLVAEQERYLKIIDILNF